MPGGGLPPAKSRAAGLGSALRAIGLACATAIFAFLVEPIPARAQGERFPEGPISKIEFEGNATITTDKIKPKLLSRVGQPLDQDRVEADLKTLMATKWFSDVRYYLDESPPKSGKWALIFVVREMPLLTKVEFRGRKAIRLKEIEDTTELKAGNRADPMRTRLAISQIQRLYVEKGYDLASVTLIEGGNTGDTKIVIEIFEGPKFKIESIDFVGNTFVEDGVLGGQPLLRVVKCRSFFRCIGKSFHGTDRVALVGVGGRVLEGLEALHERQAGDEERRQLLREHGQLAQGQLVFLRAFLERLLLRQGLRRLHARAGLLRPFKSWCVAGGG